MNWQEISGNWVVIPRNPSGVIHFLGGAFVATVPHVSYRCLLEDLAQQGYAVIATPFFNTFDHFAIARNVLNGFENTLTRLRQKRLLPSGYLPIYGLGHSMGCKLHLLIGSLFDVKRDGNILISFNNYPLEQSIPFADQLQLTPTFKLEFTPSPQEMLEIVGQDYQIRRNLLIQFHKDDLDQTADLDFTLKQRFPNLIAYQKIAGTHLTPVSQELNWKAGDIFTPLDAVGQWVKQQWNPQGNNDFKHLQSEILRWLNPLMV
ncbi:DUF1350 family protein [Spirulina sp. CS-785/01]|uniref:DUF1350 family protein n=1 Tax=Spirulina sp. CS-785/01 TaxID=3021716 RepID=UPI00232C73B2|nr:DUF1350 family protein [Spirulina sp. CS-785/01]MDB9311674.1 DUF1350 family protein [Spirulina sp. CS-785/01]